MILNKIGYSYNDLTIVPTVISEVDSRQMVDPFDYEGNLPLFTAPMSTIVNSENFYTWNKYVHAILPRNISAGIRRDFLTKGEWVAVSLQEVSDWFIKHNFKTSSEFKVCIDIANGHMQQLLYICNLLKTKYGRTIHIMTGNIANAEILPQYEKVGIEYVRCSIGSGAGCLTSSNTGVHYPIASLIEDCKKIKNEQALNIEIIADGGIRNYSDVIKALALGADYVMIGSLFAGMYESATPIINHKKLFYGMASKEGQIALQGKKTKTSEGLCKLIPITGYLEDWCINMEDYLRSAMSYCGCFSLGSFCGGVNLIPNSVSEINSVNK